MNNLIKQLNIKSQQKIYTRLQKLLLIKILLIGKNI